MGIAHRRDAGVRHHQIMTPGRSLHVRVRSVPDHPTSRAAGLTMSQGGGLVAVRGGKRRGRPPISSVDACTG
jgi:hypothetical protein